MIKKVIQPLLLTGYFGLFTFAVNIKFGGFETAIRPMVVVMLATIIVYTTITVLLRDVNRGVFLTSVCILLFFTYGHLKLALTEALPVKLEPYGWDLVMLPLWTTLLAAGIIITNVQQNKLDTMNRYLTTVGGLLFLISLANVAAYETFRRPTYNPLWRALDSEDIQATLPEQAPDIYYIILDAYSGNDVLYNLYGYDNSPFTDYLEERGFMVATESCANYPHTFLSIASSLNMQYLDELVEDVGTDSDDKSTTYRMIDDNLVAQILGDIGYDYVHISSGWGPTLRNPYADENISLAYLPSKYEIAFGTTTWLNPTMLLIEYESARTQLRATFETLGQLPERDDGPTFVFAHLLLPHIPFVFRTDEGTPPSDGQSVDGIIVDDAAYAEQSEYLQQVGFANRMVAQLIDDILAKSEQPPIIVIQADHGKLLSPMSTQFGADAYNKYVMPIQNAYYLPDGGAEELYPSISPVNSFRVILNTYFGTDLGLLEDKSYYAYYLQPYDMTEISSPCGQDL